MHLQFGFQYHEKAALDLLQINHRLLFESNHLIDQLISSNQPNHLHRVDLQLTPMDMI